MQADAVKVIEIRQLRKKYKKSDEEALNGIDLTVYKGEFFGLLGPNGAGKTTTISIICGLLTITSGSVVVGKVDVNHFPRQIRRFIGLVPQDIALYPTLTVRENLYYFGKLHGFFGQQLHDRIEDLLSVIMLQNHAHKLISRCSGGIKRRTNLIAGLIHRPEILFLDEPTLGVDAQSRNLIFEYLRKLNSEGTTIIYTTHYMKEAEDLCNRVTIIDNGSIIKNGSPTALIKETPDCSDLGQVFLKLTGKDLRD